MKKILVLGSGGMAGHVMAEYLAQQADYEIIRCARTAVTPETTPLDVTSFAKVEALLAEKRPAIVVNCAGMLVEASRQRPDQAILVNSYLPHFLARLGRKYSYRLIQISTDCVFSGKQGGYAEDDFRDGDTPYARTKALGEVIDGLDLTLRTSIIGPELKASGSGLLHWFLLQKGDIRGYSRVYWSGVTTLELARVVDHCIRHEVSGLVNLTMNQKVSKYDLLTACQKIWNHEQVRIIPDDTCKSDKSLVSRRSDLGFSLPADYSVMLGELKEFMIRHREWYPHYAR